MKKILALCVAVVLLFGVVSAQDMMGPKAGDKSMNFTFGGLGVFTLGATGPLGGFGTSYFLSSDAAVRLGLQVGIASTTTPANPAAGATGTDGSSSSTTIGLSLDYLMYMNGSSSRVHPYMGAGVMFTTTSSSSKPAVIAPTVQSETKGGTPTTIGLKGIAGAEFFLYPEVSVSGEYALTLFSTTSTSDLVFTSGPNSTTTKGASSTSILGFSSAGAAVHIYF